MKNNDIKVRFDGNNISKFFFYHGENIQWLMEYWENSEQALKSYEYQFL